MADTDFGASDTALADPPPTQAYSERPAGVDRGTAEKLKREPQQQGQRNNRPDEEDDWDDEFYEDGWFYRRRYEVITFFVSLIVHGVLCVALAMFSLDKPKEEEEIGITTVLEDPPLDKEDMDEIDEPPEDIVEPEPVKDPVEDFAAEEVSDTPSPVDANDDPLPQAPLEDPFSKSGPAVPIGNSFSGRLSAKVRGEMMKKNGGTSQSDAAVQRALAWIASVQLSDGSWSFKNIGKSSKPGSREARMGSTGLALLAFLGAGHTHENGKYKQNVERGLKFLMNNAKTTSNGADMRGPKSGSEGMYVQGIVAIALSELAAMTKNKYKRPLRVLAQQSIYFVCACQDSKGGGWRYRPNQAGDTSVVGWQMMALKSAKVAGLKVPDVTVQKASYFLDHVSRQWGGSRYGYTDDRTPGLARSAIGLLCRVFLGWTPKNKGLSDGVALLDKSGPSRTNEYYNYYATQLMFQWGGKEWTRWNGKLRDHLVRTQIVDKAKPEYGSWNPSASHGGHAGGRLFATCMNCMTLEVYYRYLPVYKRKNAQARDLAP